MIGLELVLQVLNQVRPLERPRELVDTFRNEWLEGHDWYNGETRLYVYKKVEGAKTYGHPFNVNRWGFRDQEFVERDKDPVEQYRIMVLGDSMTAGIGVAEESRYTNVLEKMLNDHYPGKKIDVINLGVQGFETVQEDKIMKRMWDVVKPDLVIVGLCENDPNISYKYFLPYGIPVPRITRRYFEKLLTFRLLGPTWDKFYRRIKGIPRFAEEQHQAYKPETRDWKLFIKSLQNISEQATKNTGRKPIVILLTDRDKAKAAGHYAALREAYGQNGYIWTEPAQESKFIPVSRFEGHANDQTHRSYADALFKTIMDTGGLQFSSVN